MADAGVANIIGLDSAQHRRHRQFSRAAAWLGIVVACVLTSACRGLLFHPMRELVTSPTDWQLAYRDVALTSTDGTALHGWWLPAKSETGETALATVYFLHGNAENISTHIASVAWMPEAGFNVFLLDYRGYGRSAGVPELEGILADIAVGLEWVNGQLEPGQALVVLGQSLGASMGGYVVAEHIAEYPALTAVILDAGFSSYRKIARDVAGSSWLTAPFGGFAARSMPEQYDLVDAIAKISPVPVLIIHGNRDQIIPPAHAQQLFDAAAEPKSLLRYDGPHIATFGDRENRALVLDFIERALRRRESAGGD